jgi:hypothetical protein
MGFPTSPGPLCFGHPNSVWDNPISAKERGLQWAWNMAPAASQGDRNSKAMTPVAVKLVESESKKSGI